MRRLQRHYVEHRWLHPKNRYRVATIATIKRDLDSGSVNSRNLTEYVAASAPLHSCDGWAFLGRALASHVRGDPETAKHLAYYAELRAAMALLATQGIGIFKSRHFVIDGNGKAVVYSKKPTHEIAWDSLEGWAGTPGAAALLGDILLPAGRPIGDWVDRLPGASSWSPIAIDWLLSMGLDLKALRDDHDRRNEVSYRPTRLNKRTAMAPREAAAILREFWMLLEPSPPRAFAAVDRSLLRITVEKAFRATSGFSPKQASRRYSQSVSTMVQSMVGGPEAQLLNEFLSRTSEGDDPQVIQIARARMTKGDQNEHIGVIGRAFLLLRVASGAVKTTLSEAGVNLDDLAFWWQDYGRERGLWRDAPDPNDLMDQWADAAETIRAIEAWLDQPETLCNWDFHKQLPECFATLTSLELVGIWSLAA